MTKTIWVSRRQVASARAAVRIAGGPDKVDPMTAKIAQAKPAKRPEAEQPTSKSA